MLEFLTTWGTAIGIFILTGGLMQGLNKSIGGKAGDPGLKGVWYVWKRYFVALLGLGLGALTPLVGLSTPFGDGIGPGLVNGVIAGAVAGHMYNVLIGSAKARARHRLARETDPPPEA